MRKSAGKKEKLSSIDKGLEGGAFEVKLKENKKIKPGGVKVFFLHPLG
jgi:hypothetical protein